MKKGFLSFFLFTAFALALCPSCKDDETAEWKNVAFSVASNLAPENGTIPYEGSTVVFTVTTDGKWTYAIDQSKTDWFTHPTVDGMTLAILIPENTVSRERSGVVRFISVSDPTLVEEFTITQEPGPVPPEAPKADLLDVVFHADGTAEDVSPLKNEVLSYPGTALTCYYHDVYKRIVTNYTHTPGAGFPQGFLLPGGLLHERDVQAGSGRRPHAGGRPAFEPQRRHEGVQALLGA